ncbi:hypothetical protein [Ferrimonas marina]|uniref:Uncharacterized protein n=1 Tax=Ferrimonas marina TaxID=299255 RepID=A0A1M5S7K6_9GAMM|nr:hypothetical protein [Ferrimonas marina]SHH34612.1 hypothetical protein SAMN02745129_1903 [Ferrimonas marina]
MRYLFVMLITLLLAQTAAEPQGNTAPMAADLAPVFALQCNADADTYAAISLQQWASQAAEQRIAEAEMLPVCLFLVVMFATQPYAQRPAGIAPRPAQSRYSLVQDWIKPIVGTPS